MGAGGLAAECRQLGIPPANCGRRPASVADPAPTVGVDQLRTLVRSHWIASHASGSDRVLGVTRRFCGGCANACGAGRAWAVDPGLDHRRRGRSRGLRLGLTRGNGPIRRRFPLRTTRRPPRLAICHSRRESTHMCCRCAHSATGRTPSPLCVSASRGPSFMPYRFVSAAAAHGSACSIGLNGTVGSKPTAFSSGHDPARRRHP